MARTKENMEAQCRRAAGLLDQWNEDGWLDWFENAGISDETELSDALFQNLLSEHGYEGLSLLNESLVAIHDRSLAPYGTNYRPEWMTDEWLLNEKCDCLALISYWVGIGNGVRAA